MRRGLAWQFWASIATLMAAAAPGAASAQNAPPVQLGDRVTTVDLTTSVLYDSNVAASGAALSAARGIKPSDVVFEPGVRVELARPVGRETVYLVGDVAYDFYARNSILNRENLDLRPGVLGRVGFCQPSVSGEYSRAQSDLSELARSPTGLTIPFQEQNVLQVEEIGGSVTCGRSTGITPTASVSETWTQNSSVIERFTNARTFSGSAGLGYQRPTLGAVRVFFAYSQSDYPNRAGLAGIAGAGVSTGYQTESGGISYTRAVGSRLQGNASISYSNLTQAGSIGKGFSGLTYSAGLSYAVSSRLTATTSASRSTVPSIRLNSTFAIDELFLGQLSYQASQRLSATVGASYAHNTYNGVPYPLGFDLTDEKIYTAYGTVSFRLTRRLAVGLNVQQLRKDANYPGFSYSDTRVGLTARATF